MIRMNWRFGLLTSLTLLALLTGGIFYWRLEATRQPALWVHFIAAVGLAVMLLAYAVLAARCLDSVRYQLLRLSYIDPLFMGTKVPAMQAALCAEQAARVLRRSSATEDALALQTYMRGMNDGFYDLEEIGMHWFPDAPPPGGRWTWKHLVKVQNIGYRHGAIIRCVFNERAR